MYNTPKIITASLTATGASSISFLNQHVHMLISCSKETRPAQHLTVFCISSAADCHSEKFSLQIKISETFFFFLNLDFDFLFLSFHQYHHHLALNFEGHWGHHSWFCTQFPLFFPVFHCPLANSRPVHSLMLSSHLFLCLLCLLLPFTVPCKMVLTRPDEQETWPYQSSVVSFW